MSPSPCGVCVVSIDVRAAAVQGSTGRELAAELLRRLGARQLKATFALDGAVHADWIETAEHDPAGHELAIWASESWYSVDNHRGRFAEQLARGIQHAQASGYAATTLALPAGYLAEHLDLLVRHGISAVRTTRAGRDRGFGGWWRAWRNASPRAAQPQVLRWGLWEFNGSLSLVEQGLRRTLKAISAAAAGGLTHVVVDCERLAAQGPAGLKQFDRMLEHIALLRARKAIESQTVSAVAAQLARTRPASAARSILRPAA